MNFRVNLVVAFVAALSFACADKQAAIPELEEAMKAPPGMQVLGLYMMKVEPVATPSGLQFLFNPVPIGVNGSPLTNPPGSVQVRGTFSGIITAGQPASCTGSVLGYLSADVVVTNFAIDPLRNVWVEITSMSGQTGNDACNSTSPLLSEGAYSFGSIEQQTGIWKYPDLAGSPVATGLQAGGFGSTITNGAWWFKYAGAQAFSFFFRVMADNNAPVITTTPTLSAGQALSFYNIAARTGTDRARIELCNVNPGPPVNGSYAVPCPAGATVNVAEGTVFGTFVPLSGRNVFSVVPATALTTGTYWWRARNMYGIPGNSVPATFPSPWSPFAFTAQPVVQTPASVLANDGAALLEWTTEPATVDTYYYLCDTTCAGAAPVVLAEGPVAADALPDPRWPTLSYYQAPPAFALNLATRDLANPAGIYWLAPATYETRVFNYDGVNTPAITGLHGTGTTSITPVGIVPTNLLPAAGAASVATTTFTWATDPLITSTTIDFIDVVDPLDPLDDVLIGTNVVTNPPGYSLAASATNLSTWVIAPTLVEVQLFNTDLYGSVSAVIRRYTMTP